MTKFALLLAGTFLAAAPALGQEPTQSPPPAEPEEARQPSADVHAGEDASIIVTAPYVRNLDVLAGTAVLTGEELTRDVRPQIGETLTRQPGVSATSFSPGASRPVLRGFQGERIRVLTDGIGSADASNTSADHGVTIDPLTAERIEVLHGPAVLLFGSQAIGGAVNVIDRRIPRRAPDGIHADIVGVYGSAADEKSIGGAVDVALGGGFVAHVDGSFRDTDDLKVGSFVLSPELRAEQREIAAEELAEGHPEEAEEALELAELRGRLPNSATETRTYGGGLAYIADRGNIGFSVGRYESDYGVPSRPGAEHHHGEEGEEGPEEEGDVEAPVTIGIKQTRFDMRGELDVGGFLDAVRVRAGISDYEHTEFEGEEVGTVFKSDGIEARIEAAQAERGGWTGVTGLQYLHRDFEAVGAEAFLPPNKTRQIGLFTLQEFDLGELNLEAAARYEHTDVSSDVIDLDRSFNAFSAALGASYELTPRVRVGANIAHAQRAPAAEELFSNGPHIATQSFEIGNPDLRKEKSWGAEAYVRAETPTFSVSGTLFTNWFDDYIFQAETGEEEDELPVFQYFQRDATYYGFELEASARLFEAAGFRFVADGVADYVRATIKGGGPVPRIPPLRILGGLEAQSDNLNARVEAEWVDDQERVAAFENRTDGHTLVNASLAWHPWGKRSETAVILSANNIFDVDARRHASFTKDFVPLAGRDIRISLRFSL